MGYLANFIVYTLAMVGVIVFALLIFKNATGSGANAKSKFLKVHDTLSLGPRKTLYIVSAGNEKFLIAGDVDKTSLISKLESGKEVKSAIEGADSFRDVLNKLPEKVSYMDKSQIGIISTQNKPYSSVMKNLAERIKG